MAVFALVSPGGAPGVTTTALALTLGWPEQVILAECDPSGGDVLAGLLGGHLPASTGLLPLALEAGAGTEVPADALWRQLIELDTEHSRLLLAGISDPRQAAALQSSLPWIAEALQGAAADVIADCGRLDAVAALRPVLSAASLAVLVLRPTLRQLSRAVPRAEMLISLVGRERVVALLAGAGGASDREAAKALGVPVAGHLADDPKAAAVLSDGAGSRSRLQARPLLRSAAAAGRALRQAASAAGPLPGTGNVPSPYSNVLSPYSEAAYTSDAFPVPGQSAAGQPLAGRPAAGQPAAGQPFADWRAADQPAGQPLTGRPSADQPAAGQPLAAQPLSGLPAARPPAVPGRAPQQPPPLFGAGSPGRYRSGSGQPAPPEPGSAAPAAPEPGSALPEPGSGWPEPGWPEDAWPERRSSGPGWFGSGGRHAAGRGAATGNPDGMPVSGRTPNGHTPNGHTPNGSTPNGSTPNGSTPNGRSAHGGPAGGDRGTSGTGGRG